MTVDEAIKSADRLYPNRYTVEEKLRWCREVSAAIRNEIKKYMILLLLTRTVYATLSTV